MVKVLSNASLALKMLTVFLNGSFFNKKKTFLQKVLQTPSLYVAVLVEGFDSLPPPPQPERFILRGRTTGLQRRYMLPTL